MQIVCGAPQGNIFGSILIIYKCHKKSSKILKFVLYPDDRSTLLIRKIIQELESICNKELSCITDWLNVNKLTLNAKKSNLELFRSTKKTDFQTEKSKRKNYKKKTTQSI